MRSLPPSVDSDPHLIRAAGVLVLRGRRIKRPDGDTFDTTQPRKFLLLKRPKWWDLPKGHVDPGEDERQAAIRELEEETGLSTADVQWVEGFAWATRYIVRERQHGGKPHPKRVTFFLAWCRVDKPIVLTEHVDSKWHKWTPPHDVQDFTIDPLLRAADAWLASQ